MTSLRALGHALSAGVALSLFASAVPMQAQTQPDNGTFVTSVYIAVFNRDPDPQGWIYWKGVLDANSVTRDQTINSFFNSAEFTSGGCAANNTAFLNCLYPYALGRPPDSGGFNFWIGNLNSGASTRSYVVGQFITSAEFQRVRGSRLGYHTAYVGVSGVNPSNGSGSSGTPQQFTVHYTNAYGYSDIASGEALFNADPNGLNANGSCQVAWNASGSLVLIGSSYQYGGFRQAGALSNTYCSINTGNSTLTATGAGYDVSLQVTFSNQFSAQTTVHQIYASGDNTEGVVSASTNIGAWTVASAPTLTLHGKTKNGVTNVGLAIYNDNMPVDSPAFTCTDGGDCTTAFCDLSDSHVTAVPINHTSAKADLRVTADYYATTGTRTFNCGIKYSGGMVVHIAAITVYDATPVIDQITHFRPGQGDTIFTAGEGVTAVKITGHNLGSSGTLIPAGPGVTYQSYTNWSPIEIDAYLNIDSTAVTQSITVSAGTNDAGSAFLLRPQDPKSQSSGKGMMQVRTACSPSISLVQVNGIATNTIIAGTSGYASLYGQCMTGATAVELPPGLTMSSFNVYNNGAQINVFFTSQANAATGQHNVTVATPQGTANATAVTVAVTLQKFMFTDSVLYSRDCVGNSSQIAQPTWPTTPGAACPQLGYAGDHAVYASGQTMHGTAVFSVNPALAQAVTGVYVEGVTDSAGTFSASGVTIPAGQSSFSASVADGTAFAVNKTQFLNPMNTNWSVAPTGSSCNNSCVAVGTSANPVYVTLAQNILPAWAQPVMLSNVALAVVNGGATDGTTALANTWAKFSTGAGPANVQTWDNGVLSYYSAGFGSCATNAAALVQYLPGSSGQCGAFAYLLESALAMNGIHSNWIQIQATDQVANKTKMVINTWSLSPTPTYPSQSNWQYRFILNVGDYMVPVSPGGYGDLTNEMGLPGQGLNTPLEKVFDYHFIVQIPIASGNQYYDPSYGATYRSDLGFEEHSIQGYAAHMDGDPPDGGEYHFRAPISGSPNISFVINPNNSI